MFIIMYFVYTSFCITAFNLLSVFISASNYIITLFNSLVITNIWLLYTGEWIMIGKRICL